VGDGDPVVAIIRTTGSERLRSIGPVSDDAAPASLSLVHAESRSRSEASGERVRDVAGERGRVDRFEMVYAARRDVLARVGVGAARGVRACPAACYLGEHVALLGEVADGVDDVERDDEDEPVRVVPAPAVVELGVGRLGMESSPAVVASYPVVAEALEGAPPVVALFGLRLLVGDVAEALLADGADSDEREAGESADPAMVRAARD
jgi:hypothetical protein